MDDNHALLVGTLPKDNERSYKYYKNRLGTFADWLTETGRRWDTLDLFDYRDNLKKRGLAPSTINAHLSSIRTCYQALIDNGTLQTALAATLPDTLTPEERDDMVEEKVKAIKRQLDVLNIRLEEEDPTTDYLRLKAEHIVQLLNAPGTETLVGKRDTALIALLFTAGLRENELCALNVEHLDLKKPYAVHVPEGQGCTPRTILLGKLAWGLKLVEFWLGQVPIAEGPVFRGFYKGGNTIRPSRLSPRAVEYILSAYPVLIDGNAVAVRVMDLRRAYARLLYEAGIEPAEIKETLGLKDSNALLDYIGTSQAGLNMQPSVDLFNGEKVFSQWDKDGILRELFSEVNETTS